MPVAKAQERRVSRYMVLCRETRRGDKQYLVWHSEKDGYVNFPYSVDKQCRDTCRRMRAAGVFGRAGAGVAVRIVKELDMGRYRAVLAQVRGPTPGTRHQAFEWVYPSQLLGVATMGIPPGVRERTVHTDVTHLCNMMRMDTSIPGSPWVVYHGTTAAAAASIQREGFRLPEAHNNGSEVSGDHLAQYAATKPWGMLGRAVYTSTYMRARTFAQYDRNSLPRSEGGAVLTLVLHTRRLVDSKRVRVPIVRLHNRAKCACCGEQGADHLTLWHTNGFGEAAVMSSHRGLSAFEVAVATPSLLEVVHLERISPPTPEPEVSFAMPVLPTTFAPPANTGAGTSSPPYVPTSPAYGGDAAAVTSPPYVPTSPAYGGDAAAATSPPYVPTSPAYGGDAAAVTSPPYVPTSPAYGGDAAAATSPPYVPTSPAYGGDAAARSGGDKVGGN
jgi:hypothetical protein